MKTKLFLCLSLFVSIIGVAQVTKLQTQASIDSLLPTNTSKTITTARLRAAFSKTLNFADVGNIVNGGLSPLKLSSGGATSGQVLKWNGSAWTAAADAVGSSPTWGSITGTLSSQSDLNSALAGKEPLISLGGLALNKISLSGATEGNVLKISGGVLTYATDATGGGASGNVISTVTNIAALKTRVGAYASEGVQTMGYYTANDGGGWLYIWNPTSTTADDGGSVIQVTGQATGRWEFAWLGYVNSRHFGAKGDNVADETLNLQRGINYVVNKNSAGIFEIMSGVFRTTEQLKIGTISPPTNPYTEASFTIRGVGISGDMNNSDPVNFPNPGTQIRLYGTGHTAIMSIEKGAARFVKIEDMTLVANTEGGVQHGLYWPTSWFSQHDVKRVYVNNTVKAFTQLKGDGVNGEFTRFEKCGGYTTTNFYYTDAGQAFNPYFEQCLATVKDGGSFFDVGSSELGFGFSCTEFTCTAYDGGTINTNFNTLAGVYLLKLRGISGPVNFYGGRCEHLAGALNTNQFSYNQTGQVHITGMTFDGMTTTAARPFIVSTGANSANVVSLEKCQFYPYVGKNVVFAITLSDNDGSRYKLSECIFGNFYSEQIKASYAETGEIIFDNCKRNHPQSGEPVTFSKHLRNSYNGALTHRSIVGDHAEQAYGIPSNLLKNANFGAGLTAPSPWVHTGSSSFVDNRRFGHALMNFSANPDATTIIFNNNSGIYQDIPEIVFGNGTTGYYQAVVSFTQSAHAKVKFSLESPAGKVYDQVTLEGLANDKVTTVVSLRANDASAISALRLRIENTSAQLAQLNLHYHFVTMKHNGAYVSTGSSAKEYTTNWTSINALRTFGRVAIPTKTDDTGSSAATLPDLENGEMYHSTNTGRMKVYANSAWNELPNTDFGTAAPTTGSWPRGWIRYNSAPTEAGTAGSKYVVEGWQCITAGSPGTWVQKRYLTGN